MSWSLKFDEPIELAKGEPCAPCANANNYVTALPKKEAALRIGKLRRNACVCS